MCVFNMILRLNVGMDVNMQNRTLIYMSHKAQAIIHVLIAEKT